MKTLITVPELLKAQGKFKIIDCRHSLADLEYGFSSYSAGHIKDALFAHMEQDLSGPIIPTVTGRHPLPDRETFNLTVKNWGITNEDIIVAYDDDTGAFAARLWWMMRWMGHENVFVLDGGLKAWRSENLPLDSNPASVRRSNYQTNSSLCETIEADDVLAFSGQIIDARARPRYLGIEEPIDPIAGHIPGALCHPFPENLTKDMRFKSSEQLRIQFNQVGLSDDKKCVCYCGSGVTAAHNILALAHAGYPNAILYAGSWSEWITDLTRPIATHDQ